MTDEPSDRLDFSPLDPTADRARFDRIVRSISEAAAGELAARRAGVMTQLARWQRPMWAAAAVVAMIAIGLMRQIDVPAPSEEVSEGIAEAIGVPTQLAQWVRSDGTPTAAELVYILEEIQ